MSDASAPSGSDKEASGAGGRLNLVYVLADQLRTMSCGYAGDEWRAVRDERYTYAKPLDGAELLFDHIDDPYQTNNLVNDPDHRGVRRRLKGYMQKRMDDLNDPFEKTTWYRDHWVEDRVIVRSATRELEPKYRPENIELAY